MRERRFWTFVCVLVLVELRRKIKVIKLQRALRDVQMREGESATLTAANQQKKTAHKIEAQTIHRRQQERNDKHTYTHTHTETDTHIRMTGPRRRSREPNGQMESAKYMDEKQLQQQSMG